MASAPRSVNQPAPLAPGLPLRRPLILNEQLTFANPASYRRRASGCIAWSPFLAAPPPADPRAQPPEAVLAQRLEAALARIEAAGAAHRAALDAERVRADRLAAETGAALAELDALIGAAAPAAA